MVNNVVLVGRLTRDPELRSTASGVNNVRFSIAVNRRFKNANGEREADFINCIIWRQSADNFAAWARKGALISVTGSIQTGSYENAQGQRVYTTDVLVDNFQMLESRATREGAAGNSGNSNYSAPTQSYNRPTQQAAATPDFGRDADPFANSKPMEISDDDLPF